MLQPSEIPHQVLIDDSVTCSKEGEYMGDEVFLLRFQTFPVWQVFG